MKMILSMGKRNQIAEECEKDLEKIKNYKIVTSVPEEGKPYLLKELYSESRQNPGILVRLAKCKGIGKSEFEEVVKKLNAERKKRSVDFENQKDYYNIVAKFTASNNPELEEAINKLNQIYEQLKAVDNEAYEVASSAEKYYKQVSRSYEIQRKLSTIGRYDITIRNEFKRSNIMWHYAQGLTIKVLFCSWNNKESIALPNGFVAFYPKDKVKELFDKSLNLRHQFLKVFNDNKGLEKYLLVSSNSQDAEKEIRWVLKRTTDYKDFVELQCEKWKKYYTDKKNNQKAKKQASFYWDRVKIKAAKYMSSLQWKETQDDKLLAEGLEKMRIEHGMADTNNKKLNQVKKWVENYKPVKIKGEDKASTKAPVNLLDLLN